MVIDHDEESAPLVPMEQSTIITLHDRDFDRQIATARRWPRSVPSARADIIGYATESETTAQECIYALPRDGKVIKGASARFAEIVATSWGNARYATRIIDEGESFVTAQAVFHDLERNTYISLEVMRRIVGRNGDRFGVDMIGVTSQAAMSIAMRNAILKGVPRSVWGEAYDKAHAMVAGTFESIESRRGAAMQAFLKLGVTEEDVLKLVDRETVRAIEPDDIVVLRGTLSAIRDGDTSLERLFASKRSAGRQDGKKADLGKKLQEGRDRDDEHRRSRSQEDGAGDRPPVDDRRDEPPFEEERRDSPPEEKRDQTEERRVEEAAPTSFDDLTASPALNDAVTRYLEGLPVDVTVFPSLVELANRLGRADSLGGVNKVADAMASKFETVEESIDAAQSEWRKARGKDIRAAAKAATAKL